MTVDLSAFVFVNNVKPVVYEADYIAHIPKNISDEKELFALLQRELQLPGYFGSNWDAVSDCLRDLSWIEARRVLIVHKDLPLRDQRSQRIYLEVLVRAVKDWEREAEERAMGTTLLPWPTHELVIMFPTGVREQIALRLEGSDIFRMFNR